MLSILFHTLIAIRILHNTPNLKQINVMEKKRRQSRTNRARKYLLEGQSYPFTGEGTFWIGTTSGLEQDYVVKEAILSVKKLIDMNKDSKVMLIIAGEIKKKGLMEGMIKRYKIKNNVIFAGPDANISKMMKGVHVFIYTGCTIAIPEAIIQAGKHKVPVISIDCPGAAQVIVHRRSGFLVPECDSDKVAEILSVLSNDQKKRKVFGDSLFFKTRPYHKAKDKKISRP
jgi:hypothetical protein